MNDVHEQVCDAELDASGLNCPLPLLKAKLELNRLASGAVLKVIATGGTPR
jgi:TusA-related sulfurtransferase